MPTDPTARDVETARDIAGQCWYANSDDPHATCASVGAPDRCVQCAEADAIARALATARAEERERAIAIAERMALEDGGTTSTAAHVAAAIRAREGA